MYEDSIEEKSPGVARMEAVTSVFTQWDKALLFLGLFLGAYARGLHGLMQSPFQAQAVSGWNAAGQVATLGVARATIASASQPIWAKIMDYMGRPFVVYGSCFFYCLGYIVLACSNNFGTLAGGLVLQPQSLTPVMMYIVVADTTSLRQRVFFSMIPSLHSIINTWAAGVIAEKFVQGPGWRWGYGTGALIYPIMILPLIFSLVHTTHKAKRAGLLDGLPGPAKIVRSPAMWKDFFWKADIIGLTFLIGSIALCLVPLTLGGGTASKWRTAQVLTPLIIGFVVCIPAFVYWELKRARHPLVPFHLLKSRHVLVSLAIGLLVTITGAQQSTYLYFLLIVAFGQSVEAATRISKLANFSMVISGLILGLAMHRFRHTKPFTIFGAGMYVLAFGLLYRFRGGHSSSELGGLIGAEIVLGIGMGVAQNSAQCALQAVCKHEHVAIISAMFFCCFQIGSGIGSAITGAIWTNLMPKTLLTNLSAVMPAATAATTAKSVYGNPLKFVAQYQPGTPERAAVDESYRQLMRLLCISGLCFASLLFIAALCVDNPILTDKRSIDDKEDFVIGRNEKEEEAQREADAAQAQAQAQVQQTPQVPFQQPVKA
ncbi:siderochrome-iron uptake transporter [Cutaneotrichosporon oleaginosum]|uniref:Siderochrome-iron uptake transporter n=1 Tax=Cutaneotrichosporon oleaginosum TaxID=879819 RepID=A0A0J0XUQ0_9TREE|nr:siderochrome-iron uptake transporter [Cutaneotrichosporon oleaginosum]KLT44826.1 siderochrome-iron uptake transporter [Cutaneotrichosporon oleaginosum]TXT11965.1 hypothetical protein COLE_02375 [Cutaneotrichosporon oleaginosum]